MFQPCDDSRRARYVKRIICELLTGCPRCLFAFENIWKKDPAYLSTSLAELHSDGSITGSRILDLAEDLNIITSLLEITPFQFALELAIEASTPHRRLLILDAWLSGMIEKKGRQFVYAMVDFVAVHAVKTDTPNYVRVGSHALAVLIRLLCNVYVLFWINAFCSLLYVALSASTLEGSRLNYFQKVSIKCLSTYPRLITINPRPGEDINMYEANYSNDIETEVKEKYKQLSNERIRKEELVGFFRRMKESSLPRNHELFSCMVHSLFERTGLLHHQSSKENYLTAYLLGSLVSFHIIDNIPLTIAIHCILTNLRSSSGSIEFDFGIQALVEIKTRLSEWSPLCRILLGIPQLAHARPDVVRDIQNALSSYHDDDTTLSQTTRTPQHPSTANFVTVKAQGVKHGVSTIIFTDKDLPQPSPNIEDADTIQRSDHLPVREHRCSKLEEEEKRGEISQLLAPRQCRWDPMNALDGDQGGTSLMSGIATRSGGPHICDDSINTLRKLIRRLSDLNLATKRFCGFCLKATGGYADVYYSRMIDGIEIKEVAIKRLRFNLTKEVELAKVGIIVNYPVIYAKKSYGFRRLHENLESGRKSTTSTYCSYWALLLNTMLSRQL